MKENEHVQKPEVRMSPTSEEWREGFGGWSTEGEGESCAMRRERKVRAAPEVRGRGGELLVEPWLWCMKT